MNSLNHMISALAISAAAGLLGAGCAASTDPGNDNDTEEQAASASVQEAPQPLCPFGTRPLGSVCIPVSGNTIDPTPSAQCPGGTLVTPGGNIICIPPSPIGPVFYAPSFPAPRYRGRR